jgi:hypothetical protein
MEPALFQDSDRFGGGAAMAKLRSPATCEVSALDASALMGFQP